MRAQSFLSLVLMAFFLSSAAADDWQSRAVNTASVKNAFAEFCVPVDAGRTLEVEIESPHPLDFNVHFHTETETLFPVRERIDGSASFAVPAERNGEYCLMWRNFEDRPADFIVRTRYRLR